MTKPSARKRSSAQAASPAAWLLLGKVVLAVCVLGIVTSALLHWQARQRVAKQASFFQQQQSALMSIQELALSDALFHSEKCRSSVAFAVPVQFQSLFPHQDDCIYVSGERGARRIELSIPDFYHPIVFLEAPEKFSQQFWNVDGSDLRIVRTLGGNWFATIRDGN